jgi:hypothetical protein
MRRERRLYSALPPFDGGVRGRNRGRPLRVTAYLRTLHILSIHYGRRMTRIVAFSTTNVTRNAVNSLSGEQELLQAPTRSQRDYGESSSSDSRQAFASAKCMCVK